MTCMARRRGVEPMDPVVEDLDEVMAERKH